MNKKWDSSREYKRVRGVAVSIKRGNQFQSNVGYLLVHPYGAPLSTSRESHFRSNYLGVWMHHFCTDSEYVPLWVSYLPLEMHPPDCDLKDVD